MKHFKLFLIISLKIVPILSILTILKLAIEELVNSVI